MKETLFDVPVTLSPLNQWKKRYGVKTHFWNEAKDRGESPWLATPPHEDFGDVGPEECGEGESEMEACYSTSLKYHIEWFQKLRPRGRK